MSIYDKKKNFKQKREAIENIIVCNKNQEQKLKLKYSHLVKNTYTREVTQGQ